MMKEYANSAVGETKTLKEWFEELKITMLRVDGWKYDLYRSEVKKDRNGFIDIFGKGGYGIRHSDIEQYMDEQFIMKNNDINDAKLVLKY